MVSRSCSHVLRGTNCRDCGLYLSEEGNVRAVRSNNHGLLDIIDMERYRRNLLRKVGMFEPRRVGLPQPPVTSLMESLMDKFKLSRQTYALAIFLFTIVAGRKKMTSTRQQLFVGACIMLAAKFADREPNVPKLSRVNQLLDIQDCYKEQLKGIQSEVYEAVSHSLQLVSFVDVVQLFLTNGVVFSNEEHPDEAVIETYILNESESLIKSGRFMRYKQQELAAWLVYKARRLFRMKQLWNVHLQHITGFSADQIQRIVKEIDTEEESCMIKQSVVNIRYDHVQSSQKKTEAESSLRKLLLKDERTKTETSTSSVQYRIHSIKSYERLNISSFRVQ